MPVKFLSSPRRAFVEALRVALLGHRERRVDEDLEELALREQLARHPPLGAERRDERDEHDQAGVDHQLGDLGDAADVLDPVGVGEAEVLVEPVADVVAVEQVGVAAQRVQLLLDQVGDRRLAGAREAREPEHAGRWPLSRGVRRLVDVERLPVDVLRAAQREVEHPGADRLVGEPVDQDEAAGVAVLVVGVEGDRPVELEVADADLVELAASSAARCSSVLTLTLYLSGAIVAGDGAGADLASGSCVRGSIGSSAIQTIVASNWSATLGGAVDAGDHIAAADVDLVGQRERDRLAGDRLRRGRRRG